MTFTLGVPQGSILGPLLFIVYINDIFKTVKHCKILSYADDTTLYYSSIYPSNIQMHLNEDVKTLTAWFSQNGLKVNAEKSQYMTVCTPSTDVKYENVHISVDHTNIRPTNEINILGVTLDKHLKWGKHINNVIKNCKYHLRAYYRSVKLLEYDERRLLYNTCIASRLSYADIIWSRCNIAHTQMLQTIQNMSARAIVRSKRMAHAPPILKDLNWIPLKEKRKLHELVMFHKIYNEKGTADQSRTLEHYKRQQNINTRGTGNSHLFIPGFNTNYTRESFYIRNIRQWNTLPTKLRSIQNTNTFKARLFEFLFNAST